MGLSVRLVGIAQGGTSIRVVPSLKLLVRILSSARMVPPTTPRGKSPLSLLMSPVRPNVRSLFFFSNKFYFYHHSRNFRVCLILVFEKCS